ncbi:hypothetical protein E2C01_007042 [Portunus trituberculatus]|uniref:Uncharacterized protein n=1 Tax=Portunus trituberculatus TaxID=210409 RepID=A0A5B7CY39_PORTR|nr:hypothetical protein [Portunus trituberculatus]
MLDIRAWNEWFSPGACGGVVPHSVAHNEHVDGGLWTMVAHNQRVDGGLWTMVAHNQRVDGGRWTMLNANMNISESVFLRIWLKDQQ